MKALRRYFTRWQNLIGLFLVLLFLVVAVAAPVLSPQDPEHPGAIKYVGLKTDYRPHSPAEVPPLGTLSTQISVYHALVWGTRSAVVFGIVVASIIALIGSLIGAVSGYFGGFTNNLIMRITDAFLSFPIIAGVVLISQLVMNAFAAASIEIHNAPFGLMYYRYSGGGVEFFELQNLPRYLIFLLSIDPVLIAFILFSWMPYARIMNSVVRRVRNMDYIEASRALGAGHARLIFRHLIPNSITPIIVMAAKDVGGMVLLQATFTFIGLGGNSPWGLMLVRGRDWIISPGGILTFWWVFLPATLALILFGIGWNLLGDGLNDALNPRTT
jgi:peptide/nickel transport system permease protein